MNDKRLENLLKQYRPGYELEIRINTTRPLFESIYKGLSASHQGVLECSVNSITQTVESETSTFSSIRRILYDKGAPVENSYMRKTRVGMVVVNSPMTHKVVLSMESKVPVFVESNSIVRLKARVSFELSDKWRADLTLVKEDKLSALGRRLGDAVKLMFPAALSASNIMTMIPAGEITAHEVELEYIGKGAEPTQADLDIIFEVSKFIDPTLKSDATYVGYLRDVAALVGARVYDNVSLKRVTPPVKTLNKSLYYSGVYPPFGRYVTDKADGVRCLLLTRGASCVVLTSGGCREIKMEKAMDSGQIILDAEGIVDGTESGQAHDVITAPLEKITFYAFDVVANGECVADKPFSERLGNVYTAAAELSRLCAGIRVKGKEFILISEDNIKTAIYDSYHRKNPKYHIDGIIFTQQDKPYLQTAHHKWKLASETTIDFLARACPETLLGKEPYLKREGLDLYLLFVGIRHDLRNHLGIGLLSEYNDLFPGARAKYYPIQFSSSVDPTAFLYYHKVGGSGGQGGGQGSQSGTSESLDKKIIELSCAGLKNDGSGLVNWSFVRERSDRTMETNYYGNDYTTAESNFINSLDPLELESLWTSSDSYFAKTASDKIYHAKNSYMRAVISAAFEKYLSGAGWVVDLAAGRGADLGRYSRNKVGHVVMIDIDAAALGELIARKLDISDGSARRTGGFQAGGTWPKYNRESLLMKDVSGTTIHVVKMDLRESYLKLGAACYSFGATYGAVDGVVCNFALHYLCDTRTNILNILNLVRDLVRAGGVFMFTVMDGRVLYDKVAETGSWVLVDSSTGNVKYSVTRKYEAGEAFAKFGQMIEVKLPFSDTPSLEPLVNLDYLTEQAGKMGFVTEVNESMLAGELAESKRFDMTAIDHEYVAAHRLVVFRKE